MCNSKNLFELTNSDIQSFAPSVLAEAPSNHLTNRYAFFKTIDVVEGLRAAGWAPVKAQEQIVRVSARQGVQKHMVRFHRRDEIGFPIPALGDSRLELILTNSHDGTSAYRLQAGVFRLICLNGMVVSSGDVAAVSIRHSHRTIGEVVDRSAQIAGMSDRIGSKLQAFRARRLTPAEQIAFAKDALELRYDSIEDSPVRPEFLLEAKRYQDEGDSLWLTLPKTQENLTRGTRQDRLWALVHNRNRAQGVRKVTGIDANIDLNVGLWSLAEKYLTLAN